MDDETLSDFWNLPGMDVPELPFDGFGDGLAVPQDPLEDIFGCEGVGSSSVSLACGDVHNGLLRRSNVEEKNLLAPESTARQISTVVLENGDADEKGLRSSNVEENDQVQERTGNQEPKARAKIDFETPVSENASKQESEEKAKNEFETGVPESTAEKESKSKANNDFETLIPERNANQESKAEADIEFKTLAEESTAKQESSEADIGFTSSSNVVKKRSRSQNDLKGNSLTANRNLIRDEENSNSEPRIEKKYVGRKCSHCQVVKTPQWREGPDGPHSLCNACGIKYRRGRLVEGYRPAESPSFDSNKHTNFHRRIRSE